MPLVDDGAADVSRFTAPITVTPLADGRSWVLYSSDFAYRVNDDPGDLVEVPAGFVTDFASVPRPLWWLYAPWGRHGHAAVLHDWGYYKQDRSRREYDGIFLEAMEVLGVRPFKRRMMWLAVRGPGWFAWTANARRNQENPGWKMAIGKVPSPAEMGEHAPQERGVIELTEELGRTPR